ncbi:MAG: hypothetical protein ACM31E_10765 [Fibrobacterota bacterium]|nr:hypothetical protein [Chitinispirillaceae bacterium]
MTFTEAYETHIKDAILISESDLEGPQMPVGIYTQEAVDLATSAKVDKEALVSAGLDWAFVESLPGRAAALTQAESNWRCQRFGKEEACIRWGELGPKAYELRDTILHTFFYAYRKNPSILARVQDIAKGDGDEDMILDLNTESTLGKQYPDELSAIKFDMKQLDLAASTGFEMQQLLAESHGSTPAYNEARVLRDQAYAYLKEAVDEVRECGQFLFYREAHRFSRYGSKYLRTQRQRSAKRVAEKAVEKASANADATDK